VSSAIVAYSLEIWSSDVTRSWMMFI
jgi:hypothetical protein